MARVILNFSKHAHGPTPHSQHTGHVSGEPIFFRVSGEPKFFWLCAVHAASIWPLSSGRVVYGLEPVLGVPEPTIEFVYLALGGAHGRGMIGVYSV